MSVFLFLLIISYFSRFALPIPKSILDQNSQDVRMQEYTIDNCSNLLDRTNEEYWRLNEKTLSNKCVISPLFSANIDDPKGVITPPPPKFPFTIIDALRHSLLRILTRIALTDLFISVIRENGGSRYRASWISIKRREREKWWIRLSLFHSKQPFSRIERCTRTSCERNLSFGQGAGNWKSTKKGKRGERQSSWRPCNPVSRWLGE